MKWPFSEGIREPVDGDFGNLLSEQRDRLRDLQRRSGDRLSAEHQLRSRDIDQSDSDSEERQNCKYPRMKNRKSFFDFYKGVISGWSHDQVLQFTSVYQHDK